MADLLKSSGAEARVADTLLRSSGGRAVQLQLPAPAVPGNTAEQLGLAAPQFQEFELGPVVILAATAKGTRALLVSATAMNALMASLDYPDADALFQAASGVLIDGVPFEVLTVTETESKGEPFLYRVTLRVAAAHQL